MTNHTRESQDNTDTSIFSKIKKHLTFRKLKWLSLFVFGIFLYIDEAFLQLVKDVLWAIVY